MTKKTSNIAVLIPHYNSPKDLELTILSIEETIPIDIFIVDDGSKIKPNKAKIKEVYTHGNIEFIDLEQNQGIEYALNTGLKEIEKRNYTYIGRLDCGDFCKPNRFKKQKAYLDKNETVYLLGTWVNILDRKGNSIYALKYPVSYNVLKNKMYLNSMFVHPSVVFRTSVIKKVGYYPTKFRAAEDYAYFFKIVKKHKAENYPEILLDYVIDPNSISSKNRKTQVISRLRIILSHFYFGFFPIYGLLRNFTLLFMSRETTSSIKKMFKK